MVKFAGWHALSGDDGLRYLKFFHFVKKLVLEDFIVFVSCCKIGFLTMATPTDSVGLAIPSAPRPENQKPNYTVACPSEASELCLSCSCEQEGERERETDIDNHFFCFLSQFATYGHHVS